MVSYCSIARVTLLVFAIEKRELNGSTGANGALNTNLLGSSGVSSYRSTKLDCELADPFPLIECARSSQCISYKHHFDECAERVTKQHEDPDHKGPKEDCVEECECPNTT